MKHAQHAIKFLYSAVALGLLGCSAAPKAVNSNTQKGTTTNQPAASTTDDDDTQQTTADASENTQASTTPSPTPTPTPSATPTAPAVLTLTSTAFANNGAIPSAYVARAPGMNMSIPLQWKNVPAGTASFVVQMVDLDFGTPPLVHWLITNIPATSTQIPAGIPAGNNLATPAEAMGANQLKNYGGPNPPNLHRYELTVYAIKAGQTLNLVANNSTANKTELEAKSLAKSTLVGTFQPP